MTLKTVTGEGTQINPHITLAASEPSVLTVDVLEEEKNGKAKGYV